MRVKITLNAEVPEFPTIIKKQSLIDYIRDELRAAGGCRDTSDPLFHGIRVSRVTIERDIKI